MISKPKRNIEQRKINMPISRDQQFKPLLIRFYLKRLNIPVIGLQAPSFRQMHFCEHPRPKYPLRHGFEQSFPVQPGLHSQIPETASQVAPFLQLH